MTNLPRRPRGVGVVVAAGRIAGPAQRPLVGVLWMLLTMALFVSLDSAAKSLTQMGMPVWQVVWGRFLFHAAFLALFLNRTLLAELRASSRPKLQLLRSAFLMATTVMFFTSLKHLPLATSSAIMFVTPLLVTVLAIPLLGEAVGWRRIVSVVIGFAGALVIVRPGTDAIGWVALIPLGAACANAAYHLCTRMLAGHDAPMTTLAYSAIVGALASNFGLLGGWEAPTVPQWGLLMLCGLLGCLSHFALIKAYDAANASVVSPFGYSSLIWATLAGFVLFGELPDGWTFVGAAMIVGSGLFILYRERVKRNQSQRS